MTPEDARDRARHAFAARFGDRREAREWWVPGRIELLGKHVDYGGGRSLLLAVNRGIHIVARPRQDDHVHLTDARSRLSFSGHISANQTPAPGRWTNYPISVMRRIARDFPGPMRGMDAVLVSSLPSAAGLSSSSAVVIASFLPLAAINRLDQRREWQESLTAPGALPGYLGAIENGLAFGPFARDFGVGTLGGSQDHTAIMASQPGRVVQYRFLPVLPEGSSAVSAEWQFVILASGVVASKTGAVRDRYNQLALDMRRIISVWNGAKGTNISSLLDILDSDVNVAEELEELLHRTPGDIHLTARLRQFAEETRTIIPEARRGFETGSAELLGEAVERSQGGAEEVLRNQVDETMYLVRAARRLGAFAASAFGAGFGGSVWATVRRNDAEAFAGAWLADYLARFPDHREGASVFVTDAAPGAHELETPDPTRTS